nr:MAG TPA: hypothetical protein [Caudoviricetes sp.]
MFDESVKFENVSNIVLKDITKSMVYSEKYTADLVKLEGNNSLNKKVDEYLESFEKVVNHANHEDLDKLLILSKDLNNLMIRHGVSAVVIKAKVEYLNVGKESKLNQTIWIPRTNSKEMESLAMAMVCEITKFKTNLVNHK